MWTFKVSIEGWTKSLCIVKRVSGHVKQKKKILRLKQENKWIKDEFCGVTALCNQVHTDAKSR